MSKPTQMGAKATGNPKADNWQTPTHILDRIDLFFGQGQWFDPCPANPGFDGLAVKWPAKAYINPPFSHYRKWASYGRLQPMEQIWMCHHNHDTEWFDLIAVNASAMCLLYDRVKFINPETGQPAGTAIGKCQTLIYRGNNVAEFKLCFSPLGRIVEILP